MEAAGESSRARGMGQSWSMDGARMAIYQFVGPQGHWETYGGIGFSWAVMALLGIGLGGRSMRVPVLITVGMLVYALAAAH